MSLARYRRIQQMRDFARWVELREPVHFPITQFPPMLYGFDPPPRWPERPRATVGDATVTRVAGYHVTMKIETLGALDVDDEITWRREPDTDEYDPDED